MIDARGGNDTVRIINIPGDTDVVVNAGSGNDTINVGGGDLNTNINSDVTVNGGSGTDTLYIRDGDDDGGTYNITPTTISKTNSQLVSFPAGDVEDVIVVGTAFTDTFNVSGNVAIAADITIELQGNDGDDVFNIDELDDRAELILLGGNGNDTFNIGNGDYDTNIDSNIDIDGGESTDTINVDDTTDVGADIYVLDFGSFSKPDGSDGLLTFSNVTTFDLDGNSDDNEFQILGVTSGTTTRVDGRAGNDTFEVSPYDYDSNILGNLSIDGGGGTADFMEIRDSSDVGDDPYTLTDETATFGTAFYKEVGGLTFFTALEELQVQGNNGNNTFTVYGTEFGTRVTLYGLGGNDDFIIGGNGDLDPIDDELVIWAGGGNDTVTFDDSLDEPVAFGEFPDGYRINDDAVVKFQLLSPFEQQFDYFEVENVVVEGNSDGNTFSVQSTGAPVTLNGNDGNDTYNIGFENNVKDINGSVEADGGAGSDKLNYNDSAATLDRTYTVSPNDLSRANVAVTKPYVDEIIVNAGTGNDTLNVTNNVPTTVNGGDGNDTFNVADGLWDFGVIGDLSVDGGAGSDSMLIDDMDDTGTDNYSLDATIATKNTPFAKPITYTTIESLELAANSDANIINVFNTFDGDVKVRGRGGADQINVAETFPGRAVTVEDGPELDIVRVNATGIGTAAVQFTTTQDLASLIIGAGGAATLTVGGNKVINTQFLSLTGNAVLDLTDNDMIIDYTGASPINGIIAILIGAYNGGAWNGPGINSSLAAASTNTAIGYAEASSLFTAFPATFSGQSVDSTSILLKYTFYGDGDLNGNVNLADFNRLAANFGFATDARWSQGNFDFNGNVNLGDFNKLAGNFGASGAGPDGSELGFDEDDTPAPNLGELLRSAMFLVS